MGYIKALTKYSTNIKTIVAANIIQKSKGIGKITPSGLSMATEFI